VLYPCFFVKKSLLSSKSRLSSFPFQFEEVSKERFGTCVVPEPYERLLLNLANALAGGPVVLADLLGRHGHVVVNAVVLVQHFGSTIIER
jgi:hypothetical protein